MPSDGEVERLAAELQKAQRERGDSLIEDLQAGAPMVDAEKMVEQVKKLSDEADRAIVKAKLTPFFEKIPPSVWNLADMVERMDRAGAADARQTRTGGITGETGQESEQHARAIGDFNLAFHRVTGNPIGRSDLARALLLLRRLREEVGRV